MARHMDVAQMQKEGYMEEYSFKPVSEVYTNDPEIKRMVLIMSVLSFCFFFDYANQWTDNLVAGRNLRGKGELLVNETYVKTYGWMESPIGKDVIGENEVLGKIVGVMKDFPINSLYSPQDPVLIVGNDTLYDGIFTLRLSELTSEHLHELNNKLVQLYPNEEMGFTVLKDTIKEQYESARHFRDVVALAVILGCVIFKSWSIANENPVISLKSE